MKTDTFFTQIPFLYKLLILLLFGGTSFVLNANPSIQINHQEMHINCVEGQSSFIDSLLITSSNLSQKLNIESNHGTQISLQKASEFSSSINVSAQEANFNSIIIYVRKSCNNNPSDSEITFSSGQLTQTVAIRSISYPKVYINEVMASNSSSYEDEISDSYPDWIEIYNPNNYEVNLSGYYFTDNPNKLTKHSIESSNQNIIPAQGFQVYWAHGDDSFSPLHISFKLSASGESLLLIAPDKQTIIDSISFGKQATDISYGRENDGSNNWIFFEESSPNQSNQNGIVDNQQVSSLPIFSKEGGMYASTFSLQLSSPGSQAEIYYTIDGSEPSIDNIGGTTYKYKQHYHPNNGFYTGADFFHQYQTYSYSSAIDLGSHLDKELRLSDINAETKLVRLEPDVVRENAVVVRAIAVEPNKEPSSVVTHSYFFDAKYQDNQHLPVISIALNEDDFIGFDDGIYVPGKDYEKSILTGLLAPANYRRTGIEAEIPVNFEFFENGSALINQAGGMRIHGNITRNFIPKSFRLYARKEFGNKEIDCPIFEDNTYQKYKRVLLRNSGQDYNASYFKDALIQSLMSFTNIDHQKYKPFNVYINGEYWGILNARERIDKHYLKYKYGVNDEQIDILEHALSLEVKEGDKTHYNQMLSLINSTPPKSDEFLALVSQYIDLENFIDYHILETYAANTDWPANNLLLWRHKVKPDAKLETGVDGRWRWALVDMDLGFQKQSVNTNQIRRLLTDRSSTTTLFRRLMQNDDIKSMFITRYSDLLNTAFLPQRVISKIDLFKDKLEYDMEDHTARWNKPISFEAWENRVDDLKSFAEQRPDVVFTNMKSSFSLQDLDSVTVDVDHISKGKLQVNTITIDASMPGVDPNSTYPWGGNYFKERDLTVIALPESGYQFSHWEVNGRYHSSSDTLVIEFKEAIYIQAFFEKSEIITHEMPLVNLEYCPYEFTEWTASTEIGTHPHQMSFYYMDESDPSLYASISGMLENIGFNHSSKTRINALGKNGLSLINTSSAQDNYHAKRLGMVGIAFSTHNLNDDAHVQFTAGTITANPRKYNLRLQYRLGTNGSVYDLYDSSGQLVEYLGSENAGDEQSFDVLLPSNLMNQDTVQLLWRYYYSGNQVAYESNQRDEIRLDDIRISHTLNKQSIDVIEEEKDGQTEITFVAHLVADSYQWYNCQHGELEKIAGATERELLIQQSGHYAVQADIEDCVLISDCEYVEHDIPTSIGLNKRVDFKLYPNPSWGHFRIELNEGISLINVTILDAMGKVIDRVKGFKSGSEYDRKRLNPGVYFVQIQTEKQEVSIQKLVVQ